MAAGVPLSLFVYPQEPAPKIAFTFDDLPAHGSLPPGETRMEVIEKIITALRNANVPPTYGFVNGKRLEEQPADAAVLQAWHAAGNPLGNHGWSHMNLNQHSLEDFEKDVVRNEPALTAAMKNEKMKEEDWHWFRYPFLAEGDTPEKKIAFRKFLREHGYKIAAVTTGFGDYLWTEPYARCKAKGDTAAIKIMEDIYLSAASDSIDYYWSISHSLYSREIPYVLLMHAGAFSAEMLPRLLELYRDKGFEFITLAEAERDEFYRSAIDPNLPPGIETLEEAMRARHFSLPPRTDFAAQLDSLCR
jgi:peptidoglycan/xylan/chitin deacetylase (PgdA/CDA1 family)